MAKTHFRANYPKTNLRWKKNYDVSYKFSCGREKGEINIIKNTHQEIFFIKTENIKMISIHYF